jgi:hypothetical protein
MSQRNGEKSRYQINRKRKMLRRVKTRALVAGATDAAAAEKPAPTRRAKG